MASAQLFWSPSTLSSELSNWKIYLYYHVHRFLFERSNLWIYEITFSGRNYHYQLLLMLLSEMIAIIDNKTVRLHQYQNWPAHFSKWTSVCKYIESLINIDSIASVAKQKAQQEQSLCKHLCISQTNLQPSFGKHCRNSCYLFFRRAWSASGTYHLQLSPRFVCYRPLCITILLLLLFNHWPHQWYYRRRRHHDDHCLCRPHHRLFVCKRTN